MTCPITPGTPDWCVFPFVEVVVRLVQVEDVWEPRCPPRPLPFTITCTDGLEVFVVVVFDVTVSDLFLCWLRLLDFVPEEPDLAFVPPVVTVVVVEDPCELLPVC